MKNVLDILGLGDNQCTGKANADSADATEK